MGSYISLLCMNYNKHIYNENQYANLFTLTYIVKQLFIFKGVRYFGCHEIKKKMFTKRF